VRAIQTPKNLLVTLEKKNLRHRNFKSPARVWIICERNCSTEVTWQITIQRDSHFMRGSFFLLDSFPPCS
jgi:hypothetical protein